MSAMADLDIVLTKHKLSDAQKNAVVELLGGGFTSAKPNTIKSLEKKGLVINKGDFYLFEESFKGELKATREVYTNQIMAAPEVEKNNFTKVLDSDGILKTPNWADPEVSQEEVDIFKAMAKNLSGVEDEPLADWERELLSAWSGTVVNDEGVLPEIDPFKFDKDWAMWERELCGFEATIGWKNTDVWDGLTAEEIRKDMDTALPVGRKARRERARLARKILSAV